MNSEKELEKLSSFIEPMLRALSAPQRRALTQKIARDLRRINQRRIKSQQNPDGSSYDVRLKPKMAVGQIQFIYKDELRDMKSWQDQGDRVTGYDRNAGGIRTFIKDRVQKWLPSHTASRTRRGNKKEKMFSKLAGPKYLKTHTSEHSAAIEFLGRIAQIANIHQHGLRAPVSAGGALYSYPERQLLGFSAQDQRILLDSILTCLTRGNL